MFITRTISGAVLLIIMFGSIFLGNPVWFGLNIVLSMIAMYEMLKVFKLEKTSLAFISYISGICIYALLYLKHDDLILGIIVLGFICMMAAYVIKWPHFDASDIAKALFSLIYTCVCMSFLYRLRVVNNGIYYVWLVFIGAWGSDTCAYLTGILIGKHKLPSTLSPKKTIEGCVGGVAGAALIGVFYGLFARGHIDMHANLVIVFGITGAICSVLSQIGDLCASAVKRNCSIKDYGKLIPGHGGVMDRFDSIIFLAPIIYYILNVLEKLQMIQ